MLPTPKSLCWPGRHGTGGEVSVSTVPCTEVSMVLSCHLPPSLPVLVHQLCEPVIPSLLTCCHPISHPASSLPQSCTGLSCQHKTLFPGWGSHNVPSSLATSTSVMWAVLHRSRHFHPKITLAYAGWINVTICIPDSN